MSNPRIEEVEDDDDEELVDDPDEMDVDQFDFANPQKGSLDTASRSAPSPAASNLPPEVQALLAGQSPPGGNIQFPPQVSRADQERREREAQEKSKEYQCIYPVYFDATRSRAEGRRVKKSAAIPNPLAREIVDALQHVGNTMRLPLQVVLEPAKTHPKDWANPGRVKVLVKKDGKAVHSKIQNKHHLYGMISAYLVQHPTTENSPLRLRMQGMPPLANGKQLPPPPAIPRGAKIGKILPLHSPALSGGGVSENFLKDMMAEMGGQLPPGMAGMPGMMGGGGGGEAAQPKKVKEKKKR